MYRRILLPLNVEVDHQRVFDTALDLVESDAGRLILLHVIETIPGLGAEELQDFYGTLRERADAELAGWTRMLRSRNANVESDLRIGRRGPTILDCAVENVCDLILLASHPADPDRPNWGFGTTSHIVALSAPCSVLLVR